MFYKVCSAVYTIFTLDKHRTEWFHFLYPLKNFDFLFILYFELCIDEKKRKLFYNITYIYVEMNICSVRCFCLVKMYLLCISMSRKHCLNSSKEFVSLYNYLFFMHKCYICTYFIHILSVHDIYICFLFITIGNWSPGQPKYISCNQNTS